MVDIHRKSEVINIVIYSGIEISISNANIQHLHHFQKKGIIKHFELTDIKHQQILLTKKSKYVCKDVAN